jgi:hypothetical protein
MCVSFVNKLWAASIFVWITLSKLLSIDMGKRKKKQQNQKVSLLSNNRIEVKLPETNIDISGWVFGVITTALMILTVYFLGLML